MNAVLAVLGNFSGQEMIIVLIIVLLLFGAKKIPELARGLGKSMGEFKKAREDFEREITTAEHDAKYSDTPKKEDLDQKLREAPKKEPLDV
jgi:sec-independent protein translocase protein TatA